MNRSELHLQSGDGGRLLSVFWRKPADTLAERTRRRVTLHLIPYLFFLYILAYLDRVNVSVAQFGLKQPPSAGGVGFDDAIYGFGAGLFFWGYWILEIPSTVSIVRWGARWVFVRILVLWGICAALIGTIGTPFAASLFAWLPHVPEHGALLGVARFINGLHETPAYQFYFFRFMLGFFEGGFFPSVIFYLSYWFRDRDRAKAIAGFMAAIPASSMLGMPVSGLLLGVGWFGLPGWRWILILEGVAPILAGIATLFFLPDRPSDAKWLPAEERNWLMAELDREHQAKQSQGHWAWVHHLGMVLLLTCVYFGLNFSSYGLSMFLPAIIQAQVGKSMPPAAASASTVGLLASPLGAGPFAAATALSPDKDISGQAASFLAALLYVMGFLGMLINGRHSDRTGERIWHVAVPLALMSLGIWLAALVDGMGWFPVLVMIFGVGPFMYAHLPAFWPIPTKYLGAAAAASAIGFINMIGNLGGFFGPDLVGRSAAGQTSFAPALRLIAIGPLLSAIIIVILGYTRRRGGKATE